MFVEPNVQIPLANLLILFFCLLVVGMLATLPLYKFKISKFIHTNLFVKIIFWIPIFLLFIGSLYLRPALELLATVIIVMLALRDVLSSKVWRLNTRMAAIYFFAFSIALLHFPLYRPTFDAYGTDLLITVCIASVLADVMAFFMGNYLGRHKLPEFLNNRKSWEGVAGQLIGALLGVLLIKIFILQDIPIILFLPIGIGSAIGDLGNSYVKRKFTIKDWGNSIPGHGGYLDRFSSLAGSLIITYYAVLIFCSI